MWAASLSSPSTASLAAGGAGAAGVCKEIIIVIIIIIIFTDTQHCYEHGKCDDVRRNDGNTYRIRVGVLVVGRRRHWSARLLPAGWAGFWRPDRL